MTGCVYMEVDTPFSTVHTSENLNSDFSQSDYGLQGPFMPHSPLPFTSGTLHSSENKMLTRKCGKRKEEVGNKQPQRHQISKKVPLLVRNLLLPMNAFTDTFTLRITVREAPQIWTGSCGKKNPEKWQELQAKPKEYGRKVN